MRVGNFFCLFLCIHFSSVIFICELCFFCFDSRLMVPIDFIFFFTLSSIFTPFFIFFIFHIDFCFPLVVVSLTHSIMRFTCSFHLSHSVRNKWRNVTIYQQFKFIDLSCLPAHHHTYTRFETVLFLYICFVRQIMDDFDVIIEKF